MLKAYFDLEVHPQDKADEVYQKLEEISGIRTEGETLYPWGFECEFEWENVNADLESLQSYFPRTTIILTAKMGVNKSLMKGLRQARNREFVEEPDIDMDLRWLAQAI